MDPISGLTDHRPTTADTTLCVTTPEFTSSATSISLQLRTASTLQRLPTRGAKTVEVKLAMVSE